jgi:prepilin-type processing-associated H-X9-DG protein
MVKEPTVTLNAPLPPEAPAKPKTSRLAIASLILGIVGPCTVGLASIVGFILGIVGLNKIKKSAGQLGGRKTAIAGIIFSGVGAVVIVPMLMLIAILMPAVFGALDAAHAATSVNKVSRLCKTSFMYASAHKDQFPPADSWPDVLKDLGLPDGTLEDPADREGGRAYAINASVAGKAMPRSVGSSRTVLFFECAPGAPPAGGPANLPPTPRHARRYVIGFCDGHVETIPKEDLDRLIWNPTGERPNP